MANQEYAVTLAGNDKAYSGRSLTRNLKTNACGTVQFDILNYWWDELDKGMGNIYNYVDGYQIRSESGQTLIHFNPSNLWGNQGAVCSKGRLYTPRP
jgi:hypothetical protein